MIKRLSILIFLISTSTFFFAQQYGNEWINYTQKHYKISIPRTGLYRIDSTTIARAGIPLTSINPKNFQLFIKGEEQYIRVSGENDGVFNANDFIEFYAEKNDGRFDSLAYTNLTRLPNPYIPLFNDTNYAFLTWNSLITNKRIFPETDINFTGYTASPYFYSEKIYLAPNYYSQGNIPYSGVYDPRYLIGEGFGKYMDLSSSSIQTPFTTNNIFQSNSLPVILKTSFSGVSEHFVGGNDHHITFKYLNNSGSYITTIDTGFTGYSQLYIERQIPSDKFQNSSDILMNAVFDANYSSNNNKNCIHYVSLKYPQTTNLSGTSEHTFYLGDDLSSSKSFLDIQNIAIGGNGILLYDLTNHKLISTVNTSNTVKALIPNSASEKKCFLTTTANINTINALTPVNQNGYFINYKTTNPDSAFIIISHKSLEYSATEYAIYRQSPAGGSNNVILGYVEELYDQFAYGNTKNPLAIRNLCRFLTDSLPAPPKYLLLLGKSIKNEEVRDNPTKWNMCLVPTMGKPASDNLFSAGLKGLRTTVPFIPTGRVSAKNDNEAIYFLNKVKVHESTDKGINALPNQDWRKHILHFAGGTNSGEQSQFQGYLGNYERLITDTLFGGKVYNFYKTTTAPIQTTISDSVTNLINYGASIVTFFGHGSVTGFDQAIDNPEMYSNKDKYPLFIANSCYSGDIHRIESVSTSENFVLNNEKGSIGFIASSSTGFANYLYYLTLHMYRSIAYDDYYKGIGDALKTSFYKNSIFPDQLAEISNLEMTLEGDPSVKLNAFKKPDYEIKNSYVSFNTTSAVDSIDITIRIKNLGHAVNDTFMVRTVRYLPNGDSTTYLKKIKAPIYEDYIHFSIIKDFVNGIGLNHFRVYIDDYNEIAEGLENNNATTGNIDLLIPGGDIIPVYPYKYAIIPNTPQVVLKASTADAFAPSANYKMQLDTTDLFSSPDLISSSINSIGGVISWTVNLPYGDSTVYFWRVTKDSAISTDRINWRTSSFQVVGNKTGWAQAHFYQFKNDGYQFVKHKYNERKFAFENDIKSLECNDKIINGDIEEVNYSINGSEQDYYSCAPGGWSFAIFDPITAKAKENDNPYQQAGINPIYNNCKCVPRNLKSFVFGYSTLGPCGTIPNWRADMENFINQIPANYKVLAWSTQNHQSPTYPNSLYNAFESFGASNIRNIPDNVPYIIFGTKGGAIGSAHEVWGSDPTSIIQLQDTLKTKWNNGYIASEIIGPSTGWHSLHWKHQSLETPRTDSIALKVIGIKSNGVKDTLVIFPKDSLDVYDLGNYINAATYPYMQLVSYMWDDVNVTPPQIKKWQVIYDEVPECALNPNKGFSTNAASITLQEGDNLIVKMPIENISQLPFTDSLVVTYWVTNQNNVSQYLPQKLKSIPFVPNQIFIDTINLNTFHYPGLNYLWIDVNPPGNSKYQLERYHFNNVTRLAFNVNGDNINPILDVTFDGTHILNGDIVSSKPFVLISLKDENKFLALNDTGKFKIFVQYPNQVSEKRLYFSNNLRFIPAQLPHNSCKIEWKPEFADDGKYKLIVQATDRSNNVSGAVDYNIQFEVVNKQTVTEVLNYPNPFSTSTRFVFTLTGSEVPDIFTIQIMTISGKVVREITKEELGNLHIGRNITQYAWDGKDEFGDKLGNGVYLYRVITRHNNEAVEKKQTDADSFFKKGIGKLVIIR